MDATTFQQWTQAVQHPGHLYQLSKDIDGYSGDGTWPIYTARALTFYGLRRRQFFYEPLSGYE